MRRIFPWHKGMALVVVLCFLALTTALVMAFISGITREVTATRQDDGYARARQLIELSTNVVMGQIKQATSRVAGVAWVSQPGMISTYGTNNDPYASPKPLAYYKLYSSNDMEESLAEISGANSFDPSADVPADWASHPAQFTDLNAPAIGSDGVFRYPILDPAAASGTSPIPGCRLSASTPASPSNPVPMPVRWIYVLRDGTLTSSINGTGNSLRWSTTSVAYKSPTRDNPIVGRIAFWTDDETCKVNINTASKGSYWDLPRATTGKRNEISGAFSLEKALALYQPARNEWQRYPGHPATTSLSAVFPDLSAEEIYAIAPRVNQGGSAGGSAVPAWTLEADKDRLYASVDELLFDANRSGTNKRLSQEEIERARFCLTAHSRAPELNLFGKPRVSCWPITAGHQTSFDRSIAFCSTIGGKAFYFQREDPNSATHDIGIDRNRELYAYLNTLTSLAAPGYGQRFSSKYSKDRTQILTEIFDYIRCTNLEESQYAPNGWVIPARQGSTMGFGRAFTLSGLAVGFICNADAGYPNSNTADNPAIASGTNRLLAGEVMVQAVVVPDFFCVAQGWGGIKPDLRVKISGLSKLKLAGQQLYASASDSVSIDYTEAPGSVMAEGRSWGGAGGWRYFAAGKITPKEKRGQFPLASQSIRFTPAAVQQGDVRTMSFSGGTLTVALCSATTGEAYQTFTIKIPEAPKLPAPLIAREVTKGDEGVVEATTENQWWTFFNYGPPKVSGAEITYTTGRVANASQAPGTPGDRRAGAFFREEYDVVRGVTLCHGDFRIVAGKQTVNDSQGKLFVPWPNYNTTNRIACLLSNYNSEFDLETGASDSDRRYFETLNMASGYRPYIYPQKDASNGPEATGDFDNGLAAAIDGPYINKPDEGNTRGMECKPQEPPYFFDPANRTSSGVFFSPNRMMPSPGMLGSLPSMVVSGTPWRTLLFRPQGEEFGSGKPLGRHPAASGTLAVPDHLLLDLFWMPVVEPYALSEPFSTAGKVNMNYQIVPFTYIERSTALRAVLKAEKLGAIPDEHAGDYKTGSDELEIRRDLDVNGTHSAESEPDTLAQFEEKFAKGELFKSASEICDLHIFPEGLKIASGESPASAVARFWKASRLTGDNLRERIYTTLYPRLTTRSNTFTVHYRVQALKQIAAGRSGAAQWTAWDEARDQVVSECRGSTIIERYVDPNQGMSTPNDAKDDLPDFATSGYKENLDAYYRFRVISSTRFSP